MSHRTLFYYDQESNVTCVRDADNGLTYYTYDLLNRMTSVKNPFGEVTYYDYTPGGQVKKRTLGNQTLTYYEYDEVGRVSKVDNRKSDLSVISTFEYEHDKVGNPTKITREDGSATYYEYDKIYQLTGETQVDAQGQVECAFEYQYDKAHNRTVKVDNGTATYYTHNEANELTEETTNGQTTYYRYDRCGNTTAKQEASGTTYYLYDTENLMTRIDFADGSHNYFGYDGDSKRVSKQDSEGFTEFIYQGPDMLKLLLERDDQGVTQAHYTMGDGLEAMRRNGASSFYHYNHLGTTHELTDAAQNIIDTYRHDAWGVLLAQTGATLNPHMYVGRERYYWMSQAGLYHLGLRDYYAQGGRFFTSDPAPRLVPYSYTATNPLTCEDALGTWCGDWYKLGDPRIVHDRRSRVEFGPVEIGVCNGQRVRVEGWVKYEQEWEKYCYMDVTMPPLVCHTTTTWWHRWGPTYPRLAAACWELLREAAGGPESAPGACALCCYCMTAAGLGFDTPEGLGLITISYARCIDSLNENPDIICR